MFWEQPCLFSHSLFSRPAGSGRLFSLAMATVPHLIVATGGDCSAPLAWYATLFFLLFIAARLFSRPAGSGRLFAPLVLGACLPRWFWELVCPAGSGRLFAPLVLGACLPRWFWALVCPAGSGRLFAPLVLGAMATVPHLTATAGVPSRGDCCALHACQEETAAPFTDVDSWGEEGEGAARGGQQEASLCIIPPFHSLQHGGQRGNDTAGSTDGGEVLLHRCSERGDVTAGGTDGVDSWGEEGEGAARGGQQEASLCIIPPFHSLQHGGQRGDDTAAGTDGGSKTEDRLRLRHRCCAAGVADGVGTDASRA
ncbi:unnamed protein product [Closterium sp. Naga37s-1]|nr:unnamed protein product [Closterium sp. Naga37s-1]